MGRESKIALNIPFYIVSFLNYVNILSTRSKIKFRTLKKANLNFENNPKQCI